MKDENVLLTICIAVIFIFVGGLSIQSCRSSKTNRSTELNIDREVKMDSTRKISADSLFRESLKTNFKFTWTREYYVPVLDSTGTVTGSVLAGKESVISSGEEHAENTTVVRKEDESMLTQSTRENIQLDETIQKEKKPAINLPWQLFAIVVLIGVALFLYSKVKSG